MKEKVMYLELPNGANYQRVEVTEDGRIGIVYTEQDVSKEETIKVPLTVSIPKPIPLIGGTEVYQKDNGTPYWYCRIKEGRDEFMHVYLDDLTEDDLLYDANGKIRKFVTERQKQFREYALKALNNIPDEGYRWIPVYEPSKDSKGNLQYVAGAKVIRKLDSYAWKDLLERYSRENGSHQAPITTYFLLGLRWLKDGIVTLEQLSDDSNELGYYSNRNESKYDFKKTGENEFGGIFGFVGNTYKIVTDLESSSGFSVVGGHYREIGDESPFVRVRQIFPRVSNHFGVGLLELIK
jgi:hypothetical protein